MKALMKVNRAKEACQNRNVWRDGASAYYNGKKA